MKYSIKNVLVATDFSEVANNALNVAISIVQENNATLHLLHVIEPLVLGKYADIQGRIVDVQNLIIENAKSKLETTEKTVKDKFSIKLTSKILLGGIANGVTNYQTDNHIDLTIIGKYGKKNYNEFFAGSNARSLIENSNTPIMSIPLTYTKLTFDKILYPVRNVEGCVDKYNYLKTIITNAARLQILGVYEYDKIQEVNSISESITQVRNLAQYKNFEVSYNIVPCNGIGKRVLDKAEEYNSDLIVINTTVEKKWYQFLMGNSFFDDIVNKARVPVLSIKSVYISSEIDGSLKNFHKLNTINV